MLFCKTGLESEPQAGMRTWSERGLGDETRRDETGQDMARKADTRQDMTLVSGGLVDNSGAFADKVPETHPLQLTVLK